MDRGKYLRYWGDLPNIKYKEDTLTSSVHSKYRPLYALQKNDIKDHPFIYGKLVLDSSYTVNNYKEVLQALHNIAGYGNFYPKNFTYNINIAKGYIEEVNDGILLILVTEKESTPETDKLFISYKFFDPKYNILYKRVYESMIEPALKEGVSMIVMSSEEIEKTIFKPILPSINRFKTIAEYEEFIAKEIDEEFLKTEKRLLKQNRNVGTISLTISNFYFTKYQKMMPVEDLNIVVDEVLEICNKTDNLFTPTKDILDTYLENADFSEVEGIEIEEIKEERENKEPEIIGRYTINYDSITLPDEYVTF